MQIIDKNLKFGSMDKRLKTEQIILHHSGVSVLQSVETIHNYHKNHYGWAGIGYHFYIRKNGATYRGRPESTIGSHAYGANSNSIGICFEGNFQTETMSDAQLKAGQELVTYLKNKYKINTVKGHKEVGQGTTCPGKNFPLDKFKNVKTGTSSAKKETDKDRIKALQTALNKDFRSGLAADGIIGQATTKAVKSHYLKYFTRGNFVKWVQTQLKRKGYNLGSCSVDSCYGKDTEKAVRKYQKDKKLTVDGCVGIEVVKSLVK